MTLDFPACLEREFPDAFAPAWQSVQRVLAATSGVDLAPLAAHSPALRGYDWTGYLRCSAARMVHALTALRRRGSREGRVLDYGSYFGNFALMCAAAGYGVDAVDGYRALGGALDPCVALLEQSGVRVFDFDDTGYQLTAMPDGAYEAVFCMGVLEHMPHTPRPLLETLNRVLRPGGWLVLDTPNLAYAHTREKLSRGQSVFCPIEAQYYTELPFEGHHREYVVDEVRWMLGQLRHDPIDIETFNYSQYALTHLAGRDLELHLEMERIPDAREIILSVSRKPA